ncbi:hypothetical protein CHKEEEPN_4357 [Methylorubrum podarium]|jgi:hypothetical protein|nr:hypothetical protein CHKEEEPN_4357 [Methylorubrum podarium]
MSAPRAAAVASTFARDPTSDEFDNAELRGFERSNEGKLVTGMSDRHVQPRQRLGCRYQAVVLLVLTGSGQRALKCQGRHEGLL